MKDYSDQLQRQAQEMERLFGPSRDLHEQLLKSLTPDLKTAQLLADPAVLAALPSQKDLLVSYQAAVGPGVTDFIAVGGLLGPQVRDLQKTLEAFSAQTRWIDEAVRLATRPKQETVDVAASV